MNINLSYINEVMTLFFLGFVRIGGMIMGMPVIGTRLVPMRIKMAIIIALTVIIVPIIKEIPKIELLSIQMVLLIIHQVIIGLTMGFVLQVVFQVFILMGEMIAMQSGLGMAVMNDPSSNSSVPVISQFFLLMISLLFFILDGHLLVFKTLHESFNIIPLGFDSFDIELFKQLAMLGGWMIANAFKIALPALTALLMFQITMGILTKAAPQLNIFTIGFPITMILGVVILWLHVGNTIPHFTRIFEYGVGFIQQEILGSNNGLR